MSYLTNCSHSPTAMYDVLLLQILQSRSVSKTSASAVQHSHSPYQVTRMLNEQGIQLVVPQYHTPRVDVN